MKRLSLLVALFTCLTIGGVYATWNYAGTNDIADSFAEAKVTIADAQLTGANGTYSIKSNLVLTVDQKNDDHEAELVFSSNDFHPIHLSVTFTHASNAPQVIKEKGVPSELYYGTTVPMQYILDTATGNFKKDATPVDIFKFSNTADGTLNNVFTWTKESNGTFTYTLNEAQLKEAIQLSRTFVLDTKAEHDIFGGHVEYDPQGAPGVKEGLIGNIVVRVTDGTVN
jgi:hypothetical protein